MVSSVQLVSSNIKIYCFFFKGWRILISPHYSTFTYMQWVKALTFKITKLKSELTEHWAPRPQAKQLFLVLLTSLFLKWNQKWCCTWFTYQKADGLTQIQTISSWNQAFIYYLSSIWESHEFRLFHSLIISWAFEASGEETVLYKRPVGNPAHLFIWSGPREHAKTMVDWELNISEESSTRLPV